MTFLHTWPLAVGALAVGLPVLIHWLTRPRPLRLPLSTVRFVQQAIRQRRARHRLRDFLILLFRVLAVALLALAFARPLIGERPLISPHDTAAAVRVVILDVSQSMGARVHGIERFERARALAADYLAYRHGLHANLIRAGAQARPVFERLSDNFVAIRDELAQAAVLPQRLDIQAAVTLAAEMLGKDGDANTRRELVVISDFQRSNWTTVDFSPLPKDTLIQLESVASSEPPSNVGVLRVGMGGRAERGKESRVEVEIGNYSGAARQVEVELTLGESTFRLDGLCPAHARTTLTTKVSLGTAGWQSGRARLLNVEDALAADDQRAFVLEVRPATTYALITRQRADLKPSSSYFLERGLVPWLARPGRPQQRVLRIAPDELDRETLAPADLLVLDHPGRLNDGAISLLTSLLQRGRPLLYIAAEPVDATNLRMLAHAAGTSLRMPVEFARPPAGQPRQKLFLTDLRREAAPFAVFGDELSALVGALRFAGGLTSRALEGGLQDDVLATYNDRSAFLVVTACGAGALAVLNADLSYSNLTVSPLFVPLLSELSEQLLERRRVTGAVACGEPLVAYLPAEAGAVNGLTTIPPEVEGQRCGELTEEGAGVLWRWNAVGSPGVYEVWRDAPVFAVAAATPASESDLRSITAELLQERLAGAREVDFRTAGAADEARDDRWAWLGVACVGCLLLELLLLKAFRT